MPESTSIATGQVEDAGGSVRAVDRALTILRCFTTRTPVMTVAQIQAAAGLSRPTVYRLLETLEGLGMIQSEGNPQRFQLAHGVMQLARVWLAGLNLPELAQPLVEKVRDEVGETAALFVPRGDKSICVLEYRSHEVLAMSRGVGSAASLLDGASGKAMLAFMDKALQAEVLKSMPSAAGRRRLSAALAETVEVGYATSRGEVFLGAVALAAPVYDGTGRIAGSLAAYGPASRIVDERTGEIAAILLASAQRLSVAMGCPPDRFPKR